MTLDPYSRRKFLKSTLKLGSGLLAGSLLAGCAGNRYAAIRPDDPHRRVLADLHVHAAIGDWLRATPAGVDSKALLELVNTELNPTRADWQNLHEAGVDLVCVAHFNPFDEWLSMPTDPSAVAPARTIDMINQLEDILNRDAGRYARIAGNSHQLDEMLQVRYGDDGYRVAVIHTLEGGHALGGQLENVAEFASRGVAMITITHFFDKGIASAPNAFPFFPDANSAWAPTGLSSFGAEVICEMERHGVIVDVTHATDHALADILATAKRPLVASHASARALGDHPYSFHDEHLQEITGQGGLIGVILYPHVLANFVGDEIGLEQGSLRQVVETIKHIAKICGGPRHVAIGTDFSGFTQAPREMASVGQVAILRRLLHDEFSSAQVVEDIMANNAIAFLQQNWQPGDGRCGQ